MTAIRIDYTRGRAANRHRARAAVTLDGVPFAAAGGPAIYKIVTLLYLAGHGGRPFEVWDDVAPDGGPGGLALHGRVRNFAEHSGKFWAFNLTAKPDPGFKPKQAARAAKAARA